MPMTKNDDFPQSLMISNTKKTVKMTMTMTNTKTMIKTIENDKDN